MFDNSVHDYKFIYSIPDLEIKRAQIIVAGFSVGKAEDTLIEYLQKKHRKEIDIIFHSIDDLGIKESA